MYKRQVRAQVAHAGDLAELFLDELRERRQVAGAHCQDVVGRAGDDAGFGDFVVQRNAGQELLVPAGAGLVQRCLLYTSDAADEL